MTFNAVARFCLSYDDRKCTVTVRNRRQLASAEMCLLKSDLKREANNCGKESSDNVEGKDNNIPKNSHFGLSMEEEYSKAVGKRNCPQEILTWSEQISIGEVDCTKVMTNTE